MEDDTTFKSEKLFQGKVEPIEAYAILNRQGNLMTTNPFHDLGEGFIIIHKDKEEFPHRMWENLGNGLVKVTIIVHND
jgi:hypothetical protein